MDFGSWSRHIRKNVLCWFRSKRRTTSIGLTVLLLIAAVILISWVSHSVELPERVVNPKFFDLSRSMLDTAKQMIDEPHAQLLQNSDRAWIGKYGDWFSWFDPNTPGNFEPGEEIPTGRPGDEGKEYRIESENNVDASLVQQLHNEYGVNIAASDRIPMDRSIADFRLQECQHWSYGEELPLASVVIVFHNEGFST